MDIYYVLCLSISGLIGGSLSFIWGFFTGKTGREPQFYYMLICSQCNWVGMTHPMFLDHEEDNHKNRFHCPNCNSITFEVERYKH